MKRCCLLTINLGPEGCFRDPVFDQNTVQDSGKRKISWGKKGFDCHPGSRIHQNFGALDAGLFGCLSGIWEIVRCSSKCESASVQWCLLSKQTIKAFKKSTGWQESALGSSIPLVVQAFYIYCKSYEEIIWSVKFKIWRTVQWFCSPESDSHSFGQSSILVHACGHRLRLQSFKGLKEGSHDQGWEREWEETLRSPPLSLFASFSPVFPPLHHILV